LSATLVDGGAGAPADQLAIPTTMKMPQLTIHRLMLTVLPFAIAFGAWVTLQINSLETKAAVAQEALHINTASQQQLAQSHDDLRKELREVYKLQAQMIVHLEYLRRQLDK
jgi:DNA uptake protein ComE-like DNA-binding protein